MSKHLTLILIVLSSITTHAACRSHSFSSWPSFSADYKAGADGKYTDRNWVDESIYTHSDGIFGKVHQLVVAAEKNVYLQTWTFHPKTKPALYLADAIRKLHARRVRERKTGVVHIWMMLNIISLQNHENQKNKLQKYIQDNGLDLEGIEIHVGFFKAKLLGANHVKTVSVDHKVALITGANFSPANNKKGFFDLGFIVKGDVLKNIDYDFVQTWISYLDNIDQPKAWGHSTRHNVSSCTPIYLTRNKAFPNFTTKTQKSSMTDGLLESIRHARKNIEIITPNLNVTVLLNELGKAVLRGVKVRIILSKGFSDFSEDLPTRGGKNAITIKRIHRGLLKHTTQEEICKGLRIHWYGLDGQSACHQH